MYYFLKTREKYLQIMLEEGEKKEAVKVGEKSGIGKWAGEQRTLLLLRW